MTTPIRVGVVCDLLEEGWHSMDLIADMLLETLPAVAGAEISATRLRPPMVPRWSRLPLTGRAAGRAWLGDRLTGRLWDYPRWLALRSNDFDLFHIVDHSYAHLVRVLPAARTIVTCHDLDAVRAALGTHARFSPSRLLAARVLEGLERAAHVACVSHATQDDLIATGRVSPNRINVVYEGVHPSCSPRPDKRSDADVAHMLGSPGLELLHVGSTAPRKRLDVVLEVLRGVRHTIGDVRLVRVGGALTAPQRDLAVRLGVADAIVEVPFVARDTLAALYRRASLVVLPSDSEGFGLPVLEAMACGTPIVASAIPALQEIGGSAALYCPPGAVDSWVDVVSGVLRELQRDSAAREHRRQACLAHAARFSWKVYAAEMAGLYARTFASAQAPRARTHAS